MLIDEKRCEAIGLPKPESFDTERAYVIKVMMAGKSINTRQARYIGMGNLHSVVSGLINRNRVSLTKVHGVVKDPATGQRPDNTVLTVYMTPEQIEEYKAKRHPEGCRLALQKTS
ncbi:hypothetical protein [Escherichia coli]|uniref:hypothetical protein n=1 Tax=Escherichia coli TaxID=562 RepID=UPI0012FF81FF|nr:hypothetical protein [Escherichia coli]